MVPPDVVKDPSDARNRTQWRVSREQARDKHIRGVAGRVRPSVRGQVQQCRQINASLVQCPANDAAGIRISINRLTCPVWQTPPLAMTGNGTAVCISARAREVRTAHHPVGRDVRVNDSRQGSIADLLRQIDRLDFETASHPSVATNPSFASTPSTIRRG